jgi:hypothetical protein
MSLSAVGRPERNAQRKKATAVVHGALRRPKTMKRCRMAGKRPGLKGPVAPCAGFEQPEGCCSLRIQNLQAPLPIGIFRAGSSTPVGRSE